MTQPDESRLLAALEASWPPAAIDETALPGWRLRDGAGGGKRVSSAVSLSGPGTERDLTALAEAQRARGQTPLIQIPGADRELDSLAEAAGWSIADPTLLMIAPAADLAALEVRKGVKTMQARARLVLLDEIWEAGGIDADRRAVMARCPLPKTTVCARDDTLINGLGFVAADGDVAMLHAVEVRAPRRRQGAGRALLRAAASFALDEGATWLALAVTEANEGARALYEAAGMTTVARYNYRRL